MYGFVACPLRVSGETLLEREINKRIGAASAVMWSLYRSVMVRKELSRKVGLSIYRSVFVPTLTYSLKL